MLHADLNVPEARRHAIAPSAGLAWAWLLALAAAAVGAPWLGFPDPFRMDLAALAAAPDATHWVGTDALGRDLFARVVYGARVSLVVGLGAPVIGLLAGGLLGVLAGHFRGWSERLILVLVDSLLAFPGLVMVMCIAVVLGRSLSNVTLALGILAVPAFARVARAEVLSLSGRGFVFAARAAGAGEWAILRRHVLPHLSAPLGNLATLMVAAAIVLEGALGFLGLGVPPPAPSWGAMIAEGREHLASAPRLALVPALVLFLTVLAINRLGASARAAPGSRAADCDPVV